MKTLLSVASARPNFVKLAAIHHAWKEKFQADFTHIIVHTGQHYDPLFSDVFFEQLDIAQPNFHLGIHGGTREEVIQRTQEAITPVLQEVRPDMVLVYGDVNGACGAAQAAKALGITLVHVEAGLRSFDMEMPEEHNRIAIDRLADVLFCTEKAGMEHLEKEQVPGQAFLVGNTMIDTLVRMLPIIEKEPLPPNITPPFVVATLHRPSNVDDASTLSSLLSFLGDVAKHLPVVLPAHHRFTTRIKEFGLESQIPAGVHILEPLGYLPFLRLLLSSTCVLTDSGGIQEEAVYLHKRCYTLRSSTERPTTVESGSNRLIDISVPQDRHAVLQFVRQPGGTRISVPALWDGGTGERILKILSDR